MKLHEQRSASILLLLSLCNLIRNSEKGRKNYDANLFPTHWPSSRRCAFFLLLALLTAGAQFCEWLADATLFIRHCGLLFSHMWYIRDVLGQVARTTRVRRPVKRVRNDNELYKLSIRSRLTAPTHYISVFTLSISMFTSCFFLVFRGREGEL